jgi:hypothetical protein
MGLRAAGPFRVASVVLLGLILLFLAVPLASIFVEAG